MLGKTIENGANFLTSLILKGVPNTKPPS